MKLYPFPQDYEKRSDMFKVTADGKELGVFACDVSAFPLNQVWPGYQRPFDQTEPSAFVQLASDSPVTLKITPSVEFSSVIVRPLSHGIEPSIENGELELTFPGVGQYSVELDGVHNVLTVFIDPEKEPEISENTPNVTFFAPGVHHVDRVIELSDNSTVFLAPGAVVCGGFHAEGKKNIRILGCGGILDNSVLERGKGSPIAISHCENVLVEGLTIVNSSSWSAHFAGCTNVVVDNIKLIGMWRYNSDGCDFTNCTNALLRNSYLRNYDDCIVVKGLIGNTALPVRNVFAENCVLWCDWGRAMELGAETCAPTMSEIGFKGCTVIHGSAVMMDVQHGDRAELSNISFEDITVEYSETAMAEKLQTEPGEIYVNRNPKHMPALFVVNTVHTMWSHDDRTGNISNVSFKNIRVLSEDGRIPTSSIRAVAANTEISGVHFEDIFVNGVKQTDKAALGIASETGEQPASGGIVRGITLK